MRKRRHNRTTCLEIMTQIRKFPAGWDEERVKRVLAHYEEQTEEQAAAENEAAFEAADQRVMEVPTDLVPTIRDLIAKRKSA